MHSPTKPNFSSVIAGMMNASSWELSDQELLKLITQSIDAGVTTFDHADIYGSYTCEEVFGKALKLAPELRQKMQLISKCGIALLSENRSDHYIKHYNTSEDHIIASAERSLDNLKTDFLELLLIHRPDPLMEYEGIARAFDELHRAGKVLHFGVSNFTPVQFETLGSFCDQPLIANQIEISAVCIDAFQDGNIDYLQQKRAIPMAWSPLGGGAVFGESTDKKIIDAKSVLKKLAEKYEKGVDQIMLSWLINHPSRILPVLGTGKIERIIGALEAKEIKLTRQEWFEIYTATLGRRVP